MATPNPPQGQHQIRFQGPPGAPPPTPEQIAEMQRQITADAARNNMSVPEFLAKLKAQQMAAQQAQQQNGQQGKPQGQVQQAPPAQQQPQQQPIQPGPPKPEALAVANFLKGQDLKLRTVILNGQRKDMFKGEVLQC